MLEQIFTLEGLFTPANGMALLTLAGLEIVLGIDNVVFIAILTGRLDPSVQSKARRIGLLAAMGMRIGLLLAITWIMGLTATLFTVAGVAITGKGLILLGGGLFLIAKATYEIHHKLEGPEPEQTVRRAGSYAAAIVQIMLIDIVFSLDSVITAVGMAQDIRIMIIAVVIAVLVMLLFADLVSRFVERHPTFKMLALSFLLLIGVLLVVDGIGQHINKGYVYFAMAFSLAVEILNIRVRKLHPGTPPPARS